MLVDLVEYLHDIKVAITYELHGEVNGQACWSVESHGTETKERLVITLLRTGY